jgi:hypothetical protein
MEGDGSCSVGGGVGVPVYEGWCGRTCACRVSMLVRRASLSSVTMLSDSRSHDPSSRSDVTLPSSCGARGNRRGRV